MSRCIISILTGAGLSLILFCSVASVATIRVPSEQPTIQAGIDASADGDTVLVANGTYTGAGNRNISFLGKAVTVRSEHGADSTAIDCELEGRGFLFEHSENTGSRLIGFRISGGFVDGDYPASCGGGISCLGGSSPVIVSCIIENNTAAVGDRGKGGGISCIDNSSPVILNCILEFNRAGYGGGGVSCFDGSSPSIFQCTIERNTASGSYGRGGGIMCFTESSPVIENCSVSCNDTNMDGGGIYCRDKSSPLIDDCAVESNTAFCGGGIFCHDCAPVIGDCIIAVNSVYRGGGIYCHLSSPTVENCAIENNSAEGYGGGISCIFRSYPDIVDCSIRGNEANLGGCGVLCDGSSPSFENCVIQDNLNSARGFGEGGGVNCRNDSSPTFSGCTIENNMASQGSYGKGGGIYCCMSSPIMEDCEIRGNKAGIDDFSKGGGVYCSYSAPTIENCYIEGNLAAGGWWCEGGGIFCVGSSGLTVSNCIIDNNISESGGGIFCESSSPLIRNCIVANNFAIDYDAGGAGIHSCIYSCPTIENCTIYRNTAYGDGGGFYTSSHSSPTILNCIIRENYLDQICFGPAGGVTVTFSNIQDGWSGEGNIDADPLFARFEGFDLLLHPQSPCIDTGDPAIEDALYDWHPGIPAYYIDGIRSDMGAYGGPGNIEWFR